MVAPFFSFSQTQRIAQLLESLESSAGTERVEVLNALVDQFKITQPDKAIDYAEESQELALNLSYSPGIIQASYALGILDRDQKRYRRAIRNTELGLEWAQRSGGLQDRQKGYKILETIYRLQNREGKVEEYVALYERIKDSLDQMAMVRQMQALEGVLEAEQGLKETIIQENEEMSLALEKAERERLEKEMDIFRLEMEATQLQAEALQNEVALSQARIEQAQERNLRNLAVAGAMGLLLLSLGGIVWFRSYRKQRLARLEQERLKKIDLLKDQFLANTSHELRTPLNGIIGLAESLLDHSKDSFQQENLSMIIASGKRLSSLVDDILDFSRLRNHEVRLQLKALDPYAIVENVVALNIPLAEKKGLKLKNEVPKDMVAMYGDENRLQQILHNLVGNAIKFTERGDITVTARQASGDEVDKEHGDGGSRVLISVADTGIGIPKEKQEDIFKEFQQADGSISRGHTGTGLGLSISTKLAELHGGKMWVESDMGKGSTFYLAVPTTEQQAVPIPMDNPLRHAVDYGDVELGAEAAPFISTNGHSFNILIVDDEPVNQQVFQNHLIGQPFRITTAMNGEEAIELIQSGKEFDMILLDIMMPRMSGYEVCTRIREQYMPSELPVIMVTAKNQVQDLVQGLNTGANDYLAKPFSKDELLARVKTHLNLHTINTATSRFVPHEFIRALGRDTITEVQLGDQVEREVSVFFSDIRSYTSLSEGMTPEENFGFVSAYARRMGPIINEHKGFVNQFMGDGIMAIFQEDPAHSIHAAIEMQQEIGRYNERRKDKGRKPIRVGMGIHTGPLIMGIIGDQQRSDAATISDTVNTAARMEGLTKFYGARILVSESTLAGLQDPTEFSFRYLGQVQVKGKSQAIGVYEFFDDVEDPLQQLKIKTHELFEQALRQYYQQEFKEALAYFDKIIVQNPDDSAAIHYRARCQTCLSYGVSEDWTGVEMMEMK